MSNPGEKHWKVLTQLIKYLGCTREDGLCIDFSADVKPVLPGLHAFTDSSFADCVDTGRSTLAYVCFFGSAILSWYSKLNTYVTTSTNHSEYCALALGAKEVEWLVLLFSEIDAALPTTPVPVLVDNSGIVSMVFNPVDHQSNKHIRVSCHYTRELTSNRVIAPQRIPTNLNLADVFTKALPGPTYNRLTACFMTRSRTPINAVYSLVLSASESSSGVDDDREPTTPIRNSFQKDWPYATVVQKELGADCFETIETHEVFSTGRRKYNIDFYKFRDGKKNLVSRHLGMRLVSKANKAYMVCLRQPKGSEPDYEEAKSPAPSYSPSAPDKDEVPPPCFAIPPAAHSTIVSGNPKPTITCNGCGTGNTFLVSFLKCACCAGVDFTWSCACAALSSQPPAAAISIPLANTLTSSFTPSFTPNRRHPRSAPSRSWSQRIKYLGPITRRTVYHVIDCPLVAGDGVNISSIEFANAYKMKPATCCHEQ